MCVCGVSLQVFATTYVSSPSSLLRPSLLSILPLESEHKHITPKPRNHPFVDRFFLSILVAGESQHNTTAKKESQCLSPPHHDHLYPLDPINLPLPDVFGRFPPFPPNFGSPSFFSAPFWVGRPDYDAGATFLPCPSFSLDQPQKVKSEKK